jgi:hypothetical protein
MLLSSTDIKLRIYLHTQEGESLFVELESEDIEKAAMAKASVTEEQVHPIRLMHIDIGHAPSAKHRYNKHHPASDA